MGANGGIFDWCCTGHVLRNLQERDRAGMKCPYCPYCGSKTRVVDSEWKGDGQVLKRRHECPNCGPDYRFNTTQEYEFDGAWKELEIKNPG